MDFKDSFKSLEQIVKNNVLSGKDWFYLTRNNKFKKLITIGVLTGELYNYIISILNINNISDIIMEYLSIPMYSADMKSIRIISETDLFINDENWIFTRDKIHIICPENCEDKIYASEYIFNYNNIFKKLSGFLCDIITRHGNSTQILISIDDLTQYIIFGIVKGNIVQANIFKFLTMLYNRMNTKVMFVMDNELNKLVDAFENVKMPVIGGHLDIVKLMIEKGANNWRDLDF